MAILKDFLQIKKMAQTHGLSFAIQAALRHRFGFADSRRAYEQQLLLTAAYRFHQQRSFPPQPLAAHEGSVFSQAGEDGIIQNIIHHLPGIPPVFIEFGVENYLESNTRYLLLADFWRGLVIDGSTRNVSQIKSDPIYWQRDLRAISKFITRDNITSLLAGYENAGILSIDVDGNDYWIWENIDFRPWVVICEYNSLFGPSEKVSIYYEPEFQRTRAHFSNLYFGCSLNALCSLAKAKGYILVGCNRLGSNAFFVKREVAGIFRPMTSEEAFVLTPSRQSRDERGELTYLSESEGIELIGGLPVVDVEDGSSRMISSLPWDYGSLAFEKSRKT